MAYQTRILDECFEEYSAAPTQETFRRILAVLQNDRNLDLSNLLMMAGALSVRMRKAGNSCFQNARQYDAFVSQFTRDATEAAARDQQSAAELGGELERGAQGARRTPHP